jgi:hypothetical protein
MRTLFFFAKGGPGSGDHGHGGRPGERGGSAPNGGTRLIEQALIAHAAPWRVVPFSPAAWALEFPGGVVRTPIGEVKMGEAQQEKLSVRQREKYFGLIRPTLEAPAYIVAEVESAERLAERERRGERVGRPTVIKFIRAFHDQGSKYHGFMCVTIGQDGLEIAVSASPRKIKQLARAVKEGAILTAGSALTGETASPGREDSLAKAVSYHHLSADDCVRGAFFVVCDAALFKALGRGHG